MVDEIRQRFSIDGIEKAASALERPWQHRRESVPADKGRRR